MRRFLPTLFHDCYEGRLNWGTLLLTLVAFDGHRGHFLGSSDAAYQRIQRCIPQADPR
ncbi:hypothetical protein [uncultured Chloroflexus sp.]|uniref:hypothetical protein n=1 Tax=uncultured Chloroflexus sp. TaxID=214040 RepID=UPI00260D1FF3|nr:hypothetical protein [uncultured Chloroflexus sp.]